MKTKSIHLVGFVREMWHTQCSLAILSITVLTFGCASTAQWDRRMGAEVSQHVSTAMGLVDDAALIGYVDEVGQRLVVHLDRRQFDYRFQVVDDDVPNAFALPGGYVYVTRGLLALANSEDQLANVLAHEIGHVTERHAANRYRAATFPMLTVLPGAIVGAVVDPDLGRLLMSPFQQIRMSFLASYSRDQEREADRVGQRLAASAGFDPGEMSSFLSGVGRYEILQKPTKETPSHLKTHPGTGERVVTTARYAQGLTRQVTTERTGSQYLSQVEGITVGNHPGRGVFGGRTFFQPDLGIAVKIPKDWVAGRVPGAVAAISPERDAIVFGRPPIEGSDAQEAAHDFVQTLRDRFDLEISQAEPAEINGLPAFVISAHGGSPKDPALLELIWIVHEGLTYRVVGVTSGRPEHNRIDQIKELYTSFRPLTVNERSSFKVRRLRIAEARAGETLEQLSNRVGNRWPLKRLSIMNGLPQNQRLTEGQLIKVAIAERYIPKQLQEGAAPAGN